MLCTELLPIPNSIAASLSEFPASIYLISSIFFSKVSSFLALGVLRRDLKFFLCDNYDFHTFPKYINPSRPLRLLYFYIFHKI